MRYVMSLMNGARLGIAAQSVGVSEAEVARHARFIGNFNPEDQAAYMRQ